MRTFEKVGLGYVLALPDEGVSIAVDRLVESRGELSGELVVSATGPGRLLRGRFNLSSITTRGTTGKHLREKMPSIDWSSHLEYLCDHVLQAEREGAPVVVVGNRPPRPAPSWVMEPMLIQREPTILYGEGGTGKSTIAAAIAVSVASGVAAFEGWRVPHPRPVLVLDWEADEYAWNDLIASVADTLGVPPPDVFYRESSGSLPSQVHQLAREVTNREVGLLIVDSVGLATPMAREGSDASEGALRLFDALRTIGVASLLIDHMSKTNMGQDKTTPYGSVYKVNSARAMYELRGGEDNEGGDVRHLALIHRKHNLTPKQPTVGMKVTRTPTSLLIQREEVDDDPGLAGALTLAQRIERFLRTETEPQTVRSIADAIGTEPANVKTTLHRGRDRFVQVGRDGAVPTWHLRAF